MLYPYSNHHSNYFLIVFISDAFGSHIYLEVICLRSNLRRTLHPSEKPYKLAKKTEYTSILVKTPIALQRGNYSFLYDF